MRTVATVHYITTAGHYDCCDTDVTSETHIGIRENFAHWNACPVTRRRGGASFKPTAQHTEPCTPSRFGFCTVCHVDMRVHSVERQVRP